MSDLAYPVGVLQEGAKTRRGIAWEQRAHTHTHTQTRPAAASRHRMRTTEPAAGRRARARAARARAGARTQDISISSYQHIIISAYHNISISTRARQGKGSSSTDRWQAPPRTRDEGLRALVAVPLLFRRNEEYLAPLHHISIVCSAFTEDRSNTNLSEHLSQQVRRSRYYGKVLPGTFVVLRKSNIHVKLADMTLTQAQR